MFCKNCGNELNSSEKFCRVCGYEIIDEPSTKLQSINEEYNLTEDENEQVETGPWRGFAKAGFIIGIISISTFFSYIPFLIAVPGIVLSSLGMRSKKMKTKAIIGLVLSAVAEFLALIAIVFFRNDWLFWKGW